ncbi:cation diffusion facilitator family transporter [Haliea sp. E1-2-M8]|uniref:cation diffusion facilitator family transporter n=1 Tax=Haliea sp. E1-2-M8 TaxID=3064706 RepID=UPI002728A07A|nr:cation diffusion facilitator family transporter [Haliea sp. E1-2-M8]MDO8863544.1 cation diffusion facilitator family transporter [Haliea sp. E1-2-M8]
MQPHDHDPSHYGKAFAIGIGLNAVFVAIEAWYGWQVQSLALLADALHNLSDVGALLLAWAAFAAARMASSRRHSYGWRRGSILASFTNAVILLLAMGSLSWEALQRLQTGSDMAATTVIVVAAIGVVINAVTAWLFVAGSKQDLNLRGAFLHMAADTLVSLGVVVAGLLYLWRGWSWIDPVMSLIIALVVIISTWSLFRRSLHLLFDGVPEGVDLDAVHNCLLTVPGVVSVHDLHIWALSTSENAVTAHLVLADAASADDEVLQQATTLLGRQFDIHHAVLQQESAAYAAACGVACN